MGQIGVSMRSPEGKWLGIMDVTDVGPVPGAMLELDGAVVSPDGTEIRPLGTRIGAEPFHGQAFALTTVTPGASTTTVVINATADRGATPDALLTATPIVWFVGNTDIPDGMYVGTKTAANAFTIGVVASGTAIDGYCLVQRVIKVHAMREVDGHPCVAIETNTYDATNVATYSNLSTTVIGSALDYDTPPQPAGPSDDDAGCILWPTSTMFPVNHADEKGGDVSTLYARHYGILRRMDTAALNGTLLIAVPGVGIMFQANVRKHFNTIDIRPPTVSWPDARWTRMLGVPRGILPLSAVTVVVGTETTIGSGKYCAFAVGYFDPFTGEAGVPSPRQVSGATNATDQHFEIRVVMPRGAALEAIGLQIILYASEIQVSPEEATAAPMFPHLSYGPFTSSAEETLYSTGRAQKTYTFTVAEAPLLESQIRPRRFPEIELTPPGASVVTVAKSRMICGGEMPAYWDLPGWPVYEASPTASGGTTYQKLYNITVPSEWNTPTNLQGKSPAPMSMTKWPNAFGGRTISEVGTYDSGGDVTLGTGNTDRTGLDLGPVNGIHANTGPQTHRVEFRAGTTTTFDEDNAIEYRIETPSDRTTISEENFPAVCPSTNQMPVDSQRMRARCTGYPVLGDQLLVCTKDTTRLFSWASMPQYVGSALLNSKIGCVSPHSVIEGPGIAAWLCEYGPVIYDGASLQVLGHRLKTLWGTILKDSEGMVCCSGSAIDVDKQIICWSLRTDTTGEWSSATDDYDKQMVTSDLLLIYNYGTNSFSTITRPRDLGIAALGTLPISDGTRAIAWTETNADGVWRILAATGYAERGAEPTSISITADRDPSTDLIVCSDADDYAVDGCTVFVRSHDGRSARMFGRSTAVGAGSIQLTDGEGMTWSSGDVVVVNGPQITAKTHLMRVQSGEATASLVGVKVMVETTADFCYARVVLRDETGTERIVTPRWGARIHSGGTLFKGDVPGKMVGAEVTVFADGYVAILDISAEIEVDAAS